MATPSEPDVITWRLHLRSSPEVVFDALDSDDGRASFWAESAVERSGSIEFEFINGVTESSPILGRRRPEEWSIEYFGSTVRFELVPDGVGGTDLTMINSGFDVSARDELLPGWLNVLLPMKAMVDHGVDLHSHDPQRSWDQRYVDH